MANQTFKQEVIADGKTLIIEGTIGIDDLKVTVKDGPIIPDPDPDKQPEMGTILHGGWGGNYDANTWKTVNMNKPPEEFKIVDDKGINIMTNLKTKEAGDALIAYFKKHKFPPEVDNPPPDGPPPVVDGELIEGIKLPYAYNGKARTQGWNYNANNGLRVDYEGNEVPLFVNNIMVVYGRFVGKVTEGEERAFKWTWGHHHESGDVANCYIVAIENGSGDTRVRYERTHPSGYETMQGTDETLAKGKPVKTGELWGMMGVRKDTKDGVLLELYEDEGAPTENKPTNKWKKLISYEDTKEKIKDYSENGIEVTCRCDDDIGDKNIKIEKALLFAIKP